MERMAIMRFRNFGKVKYLVISNTTAIAAKVNKQHLRIAVRTLKYSSLSVEKSGFFTIESCFLLLNFHKVKQYKYIFYSNLRGLAQIDSLFKRIRNQFT